jgi:hypothetical protein
MQGLLDYPRAALTLNDVNTLLELNDNVEVTYGLEAILARSGNTGMQDPGIVQADISDILMDGSTVSYDNTAKIGGTANLQLDPEMWAYLGNNSLIPPWAAPGSVPTLGMGLYWGNPRTRLRPYMTLTAPGLVAAKFYQGVYVPASPSTQMDTIAPEYNVSCFDQTSILDIPIAQSYSYAAGTNVFFAIGQIFQLLGQAAMGYESYPFLNQNMFGNYKNMPVAMSWTIDSGSTYLDIINALLNSIGYNNLWCDCYGTFQMTPWVSPLQLGSQWTFDATNQNQNIIDPTGTWSPQFWQIPNYWVFVQNGLTDAPVIGTGLYTVTNQSNGPCSIDKQFGRVLTSYHALDVNSNPDLITQGNQIVFNEAALMETFNVNTSPLPIAGHQDVVTFVTNNIEANPLTGTNSRLCYVQNWTLPLDGDDMSWVWGTIG